MAESVPLSSYSLVRGKVALLIANQDYKKFQKLQTAEEDVQMLAVELRKLGFSVLTLANLTLREMGVAQEIFCNRLISQFACYATSLSHPCFMYITINSFTWIVTSVINLCPVDRPLCMSTLCRANMTNVFTLQ